jgi:uncharacterized LabA/DUF88 family protein
MWNYAFVDWQNLHLWTISEWWKIDFYKFRIYLKERYNVNTAYFFIWYNSKEWNKFYIKLQKAWFIVIFKEHNEFLLSKKKWNVDCDIIFEIMKAVVEKEEFDKIVLVSGDWDYFKMVDYLISKGLLKKILFPNKYYSSLYKWIKNMYWLNLSLGDIKMKIIH